MSVAIEPKIDSEISSLLRPLSSSELSALHADLLANGCHDKLVAWEEGGVLLDGHHRRKFCRENGISYSYRYLSFDNKDAAKKYVVAHQAGRRNDSEIARHHYLGGLYNEQVKGRGEKGDNVAEKIAEAEGVSPSTVRSAAKTRKAIDKIEQAVPGASEAILSGDSEITIKDIQTAADLPDDALAQVVDALVKGEISPKVKANPVDPPKVSKKKSPKPVFEDKKIAKAMGDLRRLFADREKAYGAGDDSRAVSDAFQKLDSAWRRWHKATT